ncbi:PspC domain-containing protein [Deinococcus frigens]|uniref:PspC domain-containing protein n=1 Tax=Deinococcus frigens TaxID=249403 RepID=UPI0012EC9758|nr:PspC domain-containing protein [Deinococcus frigens]
MRDLDRKILGSVMAGLQQSYAPQTDLSLLRALVAAGSLLIPPLAPAVVVAYGVLWAVTPRPDNQRGHRQPQPLA